MCEKDTNGLSVALGFASINTPSCAPLQIFVPIYSSPSAQKHVYKSLPSLPVCSFPSFLVLLPPPVSCFLIYSLLLPVFPTCSAVFTEKQSIFRNFSLFPQYFPAGKHSVSTSANAQQLCYNLTLPLTHT